LREWVVLELVRGDIETPRVGVFIPLVRVKLMERLALVILCPPTVRGVDTTINTRRIRANRCECTTLLERRLTNVHATRVTHTVRLTTTILWTETIFHELLVRLGGDTSGSARRVRTMETVNTGSGLVVVLVLLIVTIRLEPSRILSERLCRHESLRTIVPKTVSA